MEKLLLPHLNTQTNSNLSFSFLKISQLVNWASEKKLNYLVIADYYPYEIIDFLSLCKDQKIKPVWGIKIFLHEPLEKKKCLATVYPQNSKGYKEVIQKLFSPDIPDDRVFAFDYILANLSKNCLIIFEAQKLTEINYFASRWILTSSPQKGVNYDNLFIGFSFFLFSPTESVAQNVIPLLLPFFPIKTLTDSEKDLLVLWKKTSFSRYFFSDDTQGNFLPYLDTEDYFSHCTDDKSFYQLLLIQWQSFLTKINLSLSSRSEKTKKEKKEQSLLLLKSKCWQGLLALKKEKEEKYQKVLEKELKIVEKLNYVDYLLTFSDVVNHLKNKNIVVGPGRGSAVSSLVVYLLGITSIDPLQHKLFFERFLNEKRKVSPDIDLDVEDQNEVFNYLQQKYPKKQVARIITKEKIGWKDAFKETGKVCKIGEINLKEISSIAGRNPNISNNLKLQNLQLRYPVFFALTNKISTLFYNSGIHPAGVIIAENSLVGSVPLKLKNNYLLTLFEADKLNHLGLKKYDFLSLKEAFSFINFSFVREVKDFLKLNLPSYQELNLRDKKTWEVFSNFLLTDIFQLDTPSARELLIRFHPQTFSDLIIFLGLNRPGARKRAQEISQAKAMEKKADFTSPLIKEILAETYGFVVFEEQISQILALVYNCSFAEAEIKRRELPEKGLEKDFLDQAKKKMSFTESNFLYRQITSALGYTFNKAHAVAYGYLTYYIAYLKANSFPEIITHLLNEKKEKTLPHLQEAFFYGFLPKGPDINHSEIGWTKKDKLLLTGFASLKEYRVDFFQNIIEERKKGGTYKNWEDFLGRTINYWERIENAVFESWVKSGLFASLQLDSDSLLENQEAFFRYLRIKQKIPITSGNLPFLDLSNSRAETNKILVNQRENESLGCYISYFSRWKELVAKSEHKIHSLVEIFTKIEEYDNRETLVNVYAVISQIEKKREVDNRNITGYDSKNNYSLLLQDIRNSFKLNIDSDIYQTNKEIITAHNELLFTLKIEVRGRKITSMTCEKVNDAL